MITSNIPGEHPEKAAIEAAVIEALVGADTRWACVVDARTMRFWSVMLVRQVDQYRAVFVVTAPRQRAGDVERCVRGVIRAAPPLEDATGSWPS